MLTDIQVNFPFLFQDAPAKPIHLFGLHAGIPGCFLSIPSAFWYNASKRFRIFEEERQVIEEHEKLLKTSVHLEEEIVEALEELAEEYSRQTGRKWSRGAVIRLALSEFFSRRGKIL